ncbi:MAG: antirestriction protein ArdA [Oscillospiraceae bacterium]
MMIQAVLSNPSHPEYGVATIPFPIPHDQYAHCIELLEALEIGDALKTDCKVEKIDSFYDVLKRTEMLTVNVEELNYLAKRLESFDSGEAAQFLAMAHKLELFELKDLINLTFCCQQATVITDFSDLAAVGRDHYMNLHGGSAKTEELDALDGKGTARQLIENGGGTITPYGVVYDNGMKLEQVYDGRFFPCYYYKPNTITVAVSSKNEPENTEHLTWLHLPMEREEIDRTLLRGGITGSEDVRLRLEDSQLPNEVDVLLDMEYETLSDLNELAEATDGLSKADMEKLGAVVMLAKPKSAAQIKNLAENLDLFDFASGAHTPEEYGKYMIRQSGRFEYDENLDAFYDYEKYGAERMNEEDGMFTDRGYVAYKGYYSMEEVMNGSQSSHMEMGGLSR